ncbi:MAG: hypothetical protein ACK55I_05965, partial [bacterium]
MGYAPARVSLPERQGEWKPEEYLFPGPRPVRAVRLPIEKFEPVRGGVPAVQPLHGVQPQSGSSAHPRGSGGGGGSTRRATLAVARTRL